MRIGVLTLCYNEELLLPAVLKNWQGKVDTHLVLHTDKPWHGQELPHDRSEEISRSFGAYFVRLPWKDEAEQRNWGLAYLYDCDYVLIVDADELYTEADQQTLLSSLGVPGKFDNLDCYRAEKVVTYFKTPDYRLDPPDSHQPVVAVNPKKRLFTETRIPGNYQIPLPISLHHLSYLRDDQRLVHKFQQFEHYDQVKRDWFENTWKTWTPESEDVRAYGREKSKAIYNPMPEELRLLITS